MPKNKGRETQNTAVIKAEWLFRDKNAVSQLNQRGWLYLLEFHAYEVVTAVCTADVFHFVVSHANVKCHKCAYFNAKMMQLLSVFKL